MKRLNTADWVDYARHVAEPEVAEEIRQRLKATPSAGGQLGAWRRLTELGRQDRHEVPGRRQALHLVKVMGRHYLAAGALASGASKPSKDRRTLVAELAFAPQPRPPGLRGGSASRHAVYTAANYVVDVQLEEAGDATCLRGQLALAAGDLPAQRRVPVLMLAGDDLVHGTLCDEGGEFSADGLQKTPSDLHFLVARDVRIQVPLS